MKEKSFERKTELLEAALNEFTEKSYEDASLNTIIKHAGISKGTFYYHYSDKQALYLFLLESAVKAKWDFIHSKTAENPQELRAGSIFETFKLQAKLGVEFARKYPKYHKLSRMLSKEQGSPIYAAAKAYLGADTEETLGEMVDAAMARGDFKSGISREFIIKILTFMFHGFDEIFNAEKDPEPEVMLGNLDMYVDFICKGMGNERRLQ